MYLGFLIHVFLHFLIVQTNIAKHQPVEDDDENSSASSNSTIGEYSDAVEYQDTGDDHDAEDDRDHGRNDLL